jgi:hypothetical protein
MTDGSEVSPSVLSSEYILECSFFHSPSKAVFVPVTYLDQCNLWGGRFCSQWLLFLLTPQEAHSRAVLILSRNQQSTEEGLGLDVRKIRRKIHQWKDNTAGVAVTLRVMLCRGYNLNNCDIYTGCPRRNVQYFGRVFLMLNYTDITQNTYIRSD